MKGEKGIVILAPMVGCKRSDKPELAEDDQTRVFGFRAAYAFDVSQTEGEALPEFARVQGDPAGCTGRLKTLWRHEDVGHTQESKLLEFVKYENTDNVLDSVKPTRLIQRMLTIGTTRENGDIVLDFFAGSSTTGHAVLSQNREDGGRRRYIGVQFPEPLPVPETRLKTLTDVSKERLRTVIAKRAEAPQGELELREELPEGFRVFRLAESNMKRWAATSAVSWCYRKPAPSRSLPIDSSMTCSAISAGFRRTRALRKMRR